MTTTTTQIPVEALRDKAGNLVHELWTKFNILYPKQEDVDLYLQPGQYLPLWQNRRDGWAHQKCVITTLTALVINGRAIVKGGDDKKLSTHPKLEAWDNPSDTGISGAAAQLRYPGGLRKLHVGPTPTLVTSSQRHFKEMDLPANKFRDFTKDCKVMQGYALEIATPDRPDFADLPYAHKQIYNVMTEKVEMFRMLPLPIILSDEEDVVLAGYPASWKKALDAFYKVFNIKEAGIVYSGIASDVLSDVPPDVVWRNASVPNDLGHSTLDPQIYNRMLPFDGPNLVEEYL